MASNDSSGYRVLGPIGSGGTADIYEAVSEHGESGSTKVAIKRFSENVATPEFLDRFLEESRSLIALSHPGIVRVLDYGVSEGRPFLVLELVDGMDLASIEEAVGRAGETIPVDVALAAITFAGEALDYAHHAIGESSELLEIIHGDISPENVLISWTGEVKLTDFGIAVDGGKRDFMAPERKRGAPASRAADVFALGTTLSRLLADESPGELRTIFEGVLADAPERRPSAGAFASELRGVLKKRGVRDARATIRAFLAFVSALKKPVPPPAAKISTPNLFAIPKLITGSLASAPKRTKVQAAPSAKIIADVIAEPELMEPTPVSESEPMIGAQLHGFRIEAAISQRGSAVVYRARHVMFDREYAVKVIRPEWAGDAGVIERFKREALMLSKLEHPHVVRAADFGVTPGGAPFVAMELVPGVNLNELVKRTGPLAPRRAAQVARQIASALDAAHRAGLLHRDVKPTNIMVLEQPSGDFAKLIDFGVVRELGDVRDRLTATGQMIGTPAYMAPEQIVGARDVGPAADLYALGCVIYFMLAGAPPFGKVALVAMDGHLHREPVPLPPTGGLERVAHALMSKRAEDRPQNAAEIIAAIDTLLAPPAPPPPSSRWWRYAIGAIAGSAAAMVYLAFRSGTPQSPQPDPPPPPPVEQRVLAEPRPAVVPRTIVEEDQEEPPRKTTTKLPRKTPPTVEPRLEPRSEPVPVPVPVPVPDLSDLKKAIAALPPKIARLKDPTAQTDFDHRYLDLRSSIKANLTEDARRTLATAIERLDHDIDARLIKKQ